MVMEAALLKPVVDAILGLIKSGKKVKLKHDAEQALQEAIRELLSVNPNQGRIEAQIAIAKAAGIISHDLVLAEDMLSKVKAKPKRMARKAMKKIASGTRKVARALRGKTPPAKRKSSTTAKRRGVIRGRR